jgi:hypothetical protein
MWLILFLASSAFCSYLILSSVSSYLKFEVTTKIKIIPQNPINFPAIRLCDDNFFSGENSRKLVNDCLNASGIQIPLNITTSNKKYMQGYLSYLRGIVKQKMVILSKEEKKKFSMDIKNVFVSGYYGNIEITAENFTYDYDKIRGNCFTFNSGLDLKGSQIPVLISTQTGASNSLRLELILPPTDFYSLGNYHGAQVFVGDSSMDVSEYETCALPPGFMSSMEITKTVSKALPYPYSDCNPDPSYKQYEAVVK